MFEDDKTVSGFEPDAEQENVADSPIDETEETETTDTDAEGQETADEEGAPEQEEQAEPAEQPPQKKPPQSKDEDSKYAAARREEAARRSQVEAELKAERARNDAFAKRYGYSDFAAMERAEQAKQYTEQGVPDAVAQELVAMKNQLAQVEAEREAAKREKAEQAQYMTLMERFPETRQMAQLPDEVQTAIENGETPLNAFLNWKVKHLESENTALKQNQTNKQKALGSLKGASAATPQKRDSFLEGLG